MTPMITAVVGLVCILAWIYFGYLLAWSDTTTPHKFGLYSSLGLGVIKFSMSLFFLPLPDALIIGSSLFLIAIGVGYPVSSLLFQKRIKHYR
jgi:hypothetical protein